MAFGQDLPPPSEQKRVPRPYVEPEDVPDIDRFDECECHSFESYGLCSNISIKTQNLLRKVAKGATFLWFTGATIK